eukprot:COSAG02_NODE_46730_length_346_cov_1.251012_1_plen_20_part_10
MTVVGTLLLLLLQLLGAGAS